jgi:hypothetical protein
MDRKKLKIPTFLNPFFWGYPTPANIIVIIFGVVPAVTFVAFVFSWFFYFVENLIPWPPLG